MAYIEMKGVTRVYETGDVKIHALNGVDLQIEQGELAIIVGPSGAGKTTLLNLLGAWTWPPPAPSGWTAGRSWASGAGS